MSKSLQENEAEIRGLIQERTEAVRSKNTERLISTYAPDVVSFDVVDPLRYIGRESIEERMNEWFSSFEGPIGFDTRDLSVTASDDLAFCHCLNQVNATTNEGDRLEMWWRETLCYRKNNDKWLITHQHSSVPFNVDTGKASTDLTP